MSMESELDYNAMLTTMNYYVGRKNQGSFLKPTRNCNGKDNIFEFVIHTQSDYNYRMNPESWRSISRTAFS